MKKLTIMIISATVLIITSCGGKQEKENSTIESVTTEEPEVSEETNELKEIEKASDEIVNKAEEINQQLDSLLNEI